jgi:lysyl-tRNA synthetase class 2
MARSEEGWWTPARLADRRPALRLRAEITRAFRDWFAAREFAEVETAILQVSPGNEVHLHAPRSEITDADGRARARYLRTSPEFACKKLLAAGEPRIYEFARVFRDRETGPLHLLEFTMLEWYRAGAPVAAVAGDCARLIALAAEIARTRRVEYRGRAADPRAEPERVTVAEAFERHAGIDLLATIAGREGDREALAAAATRIGLRVADDDTWSDIFSRVLVAKVEPKLGDGRMTLLDEYPIVEAALARPVPGRPEVAERFEIYLCGIELANGYGELTDADEQRRRFDEAMGERERRYGERYPIDEDFLKAVAAMPAASGVALGFDRLVMLTTGAPAIDMVLWTPP